MKAELSGTRGAMVILAKRGDPKPSIMYCSIEMDGDFIDYLRKVENRIFQHCPDHEPISAYPCEFHKRGPARILIDIGSPFKVDEIIGELLDKCYQQLIDMAVELVAEDEKQ
jgi:hypothetical protein